MRKAKILSESSDSTSSTEQLKTAILRVIPKLNGFVLPLIIPPIDSIEEDLLFEVYEHLLKIGKQRRIDVLLYTFGGDAHTAYHVGRLLQDYATEELRMYILREAKSAGTLIACAGDQMVFSEISELGPMDPQIALGEGKRFSPLAIKHTLELIANEGKQGHSEIAKALSDKLPEPFILGEHIKSLETGKAYIEKLLTSRMFRNEPEKSKSIAIKLVEGYPDHGYCIDKREAKSIGLIVRDVPDDVAPEIFDVMKAFKRAWKDFDDAFRASFKEVDNEKKVENNLLAYSIYKGMKQLADEVIEKQLSAQAKSEMTKVVDINPS
jgi:hypothetical protein